MPLSDIYARFTIRTKILQDGWNKVVPATPSTIAGRLWESIRNEFNQEATKYVLTFSTPTGSGDFNNNDTLGLIIPLLVLEYASPAAGRSPTLTARSINYVSTPWQRISNADAFLFKIFGQVSSTNEIQAAKFISNFTSVLGSIGTILSAGPTSGISVVVGALGQNAVQQVATNIDTTLTKAFSKESTTVFVQALGPDVRVESDRRFFWTQSNWFLQTLDGTPVCETSIQMQFASNLVRPEASSDLMQPQQATQNFSPNKILFNAKTPFPGWSAPQTLDKLSLNAAELTGLGNALGTRPYSTDAVRLSIQSAISTAEGYLTGQVGLSAFDSIRAIGEIASDKLAFSDPDLFKIPFFAANRSYLASMGFPVSPSI